MLVLADPVSPCLFLFSRPQRDPPDDMKVGLKLVRWMASSRRV